MTNSTYESWLSNATAGTYTPLAPERLAEMFEYTCKYGSGNLWTGQNGTACGYVRELLREVENLRAEIQRR
jgi:adenine-specific DNA methylase